MKIFGYNIGLKAEGTGGSVGDLSVNENPMGIHKAYIPNYLYKPPFGYPRAENMPLLREFSRNPYVYSIVKTLADEAASTDYDIKYKKGVDPTPDLDKKREAILDFFENPNGNKESFSAILRAVVRDICEVDSGIIIKVYNALGELVEIYARDGASFLKNPDIYGYLGGRKDYVEPMNVNYMEKAQVGQQENVIHQYSLAYKETAAYFQYGTTAAALPVPFGKREVIYLMQNPRSESIYGRSPIEILSDIILTLVYGANYNLDFYMNNNMPEGVISILGADKASITGFRERFDKQFRVKDEKTGFWKRIAFRIPVVNQETKFTPFQLDPKVMQIIEQQTWFTKLAWACFGITADEMGFTESSNRATGENQSDVYKRKAVRPLLALIKYHMDQEIISEWGEDAFRSLEFVWDDYDLGEDTQKHQLYQMQINMGIKTPEMVAEEEGINLEELKKYKEEAREVENEQLEKQYNMGSGEEESSYSGSDKLDEKKSLGMKAKYIKRTGGPGNYRYWYRNPKTGRLQSGKKPESSEKKPQSIDAQIKDMQGHHDEHIATLSKQFPGRKVYGRMKDKDSILGKFERKPDLYKKVSDLRDVSGMRIESTNLKDLHNDLAKLQKNHNVVKVKDYVKTPKAGYRSIHAIIEKNGKYTEVQIRTKNMTIIGDYMHKIYKPEAHLKKKVKLFKEKLDKYTLDLAEHFNKLDKGLRSVIPGCIEAARVTVGCL